MSFRYPVGVHISETPGRLFIAAVFDFNGSQFPRFRIVYDQVHLSFTGTAPEVQLPGGIHVAPVLPDEIHHQVLEHAASVRP